MNNLKIYKFRSYLGIASFFSAGEEMEFECKTLVVIWGLTFFRGMQENVGIYSCNMLFFKWFETKFDKSKMFFQFFSNKLNSSLKLFSAKMQTAATATATEAFTQHHQNKLNFYCWSKIRAK